MREFFSRHWQKFRQGIAEGYAAPSTAPKTFSAGVMEGILTGAIIGIPVVVAVGAIGALTSKKTVSAVAPHDSWTSQLESNGQEPERLQR